MSATVATEHGARIDGAARRLVSLLSWPGDGNRPAAPARLARAAALINVTGISADAGFEIDGKRLDLFKKIMPTASRLAYLTPVALWESPYAAVIRTLAGTLGFIVVGRPLADPIDKAEFRSVFAELQRSSTGRPRTVSRRSPAGASHDTHEPACHSVHASF